MWNGGGRLVERGSSALRPISFTQSCRLLLVKCPMACSKYFILTNCVTLTQNPGNSKTQAGWPQTIQVDPREREHVVRFLRDAEVGQPHLRGSREPSWADHRSKQPPKLPQDGHNLFHNTLTFPAQTTLNTYPERELELVKTQSSRRLLHTRSSELRELTESSPTMRIFRGFKSRCRTLRSCR